MLTDSLVRPLPMENWTAGYFTLGQCFRIFCSERGFQAPGEADFLAMSSTSLSSRCGEDGVVRSPGLYCRRRVCRYWDYCRQLELLSWKCRYAFRSVARHGDHVFPVSSAFVRRRSEGASVHCYSGGLCELCAC